jgi:hypothetical protein
MVIIPSDLGMIYSKKAYTYMEDWNGKHPIPWDYFNSVNTSSGKKFKWFFTTGFLLIIILI